MECSLQNGTLIINELIWGKNGYNLKNCNLCEKSTFKPAEKLKLQCFFFVVVFFYGH